LRSWTASSGFKCGGADAEEERWGMSLQTSGFQSGCSGMDGEPGDGEADSALTGSADELARPGDEWAA